MRVSVVYDEGTQRLRIVGFTRTPKIVLTGNRITTQEAYNFGLVNRGLEQGVATMANARVKDKSWGKAICE